MNQTSYKKSTSSPNQLPFIAMSLATAFVFINLSRNYL